MATEKFNLSVILSFLTRGGANFTSFRKNIKGLGESMKSVGQEMTTKLTLPILAFGANAVRIGSGFQSTMNMVGAVTNTTGKDFQALKDQAQLLGRTTQYSARQSAEAMKFMGMAGMEANTIIAASPKVLQLAASAQLDMADAADITTNIMAGWNKSAAEMGEVNDVLVAGFTKSNMSLPQLGAAMKKVGPMANALKMPFENVTAAIGLLGNAGIQGEEAGTGLKTMMSKLIAPSKAATKVMEYFELNFKKANGEVKDITGIIKEFENALAKGADETELTTAAVEIFGLRGIQIITALVGQGSDKLDKLTKKLKDPGISARISERQMTGLPGAIKEVSSAWEGLNVALTEGELGRVVGNLGRKLADIIRSVTTWAEQNPKLVQSIGELGALVAAGGPLLMGLGTALTIFSALTGPVGLIIAAMAGIGVVIKLAQAAREDEQNRKIKASQVAGLGAFRKAEEDLMAGKASEDQRRAEMLQGYTGARGAAVIASGKYRDELLLKIETDAGINVKTKQVKSNKNIIVENESKAGPTIYNIAPVGGF